MELAQELPRNKGKNQTGDHIELVAHWQHSQEMSPAFKRLMAILLRPQDSQSIGTSWAEKEHQNE